MVRAWCPVVTILGPQASHPALGVLLRRPHPLIKCEWFLGPLFLSLAQGELQAVLQQLEGRAVPGAPTMRRMRKSERVRLSKAHRNQEDPVKLPLWGRLAGSTLALGQKELNPLLRDHNSRQRQELRSSVAISAVTFA